MKVFMVAPWIWTGDSNERLSSTAIYTSGFDLDTHGHGCQKSDFTGNSQIRIQNSILCQVEDNAASDLNISFCLLFQKVMGMEGINSPGAICTT